MTPPRVFISYSHDSEAHRVAVLQLSERLRADGVETILDRYVNGSPPQGWPRWMLDELERATHVLCVCTPTYYRRFRGHEQLGVGKGVTWEGAVITQELYDANCQNRRVIPVLIGDTNPGSIPEPLRSANHYRFETDFENLYDAILGQAGVEPGPLGPLKRKPRGDSTHQQGTAPIPPVPSEKQNPSSEPTAEDLAAVFAETVSAIEAELGSAPATAKFLGTELPGEARLVRQEDSQWKVVPRFAGGGVDTAPVLRGVADRLPRFRGSKQEWDALEKVVGGVLVLGMNPRWVWSRRREVGSGPVLFPRYAGRVDIGPNEGANFLTAIASALAGGCAKLERVFGPLDAKRIPDLSASGPAVTLADRQRELQRHFVRYVLGPSDEWDVDTLDGEQLSVLFQRVLGMFRVALAVDRNPYIASGPRMVGLVAEIRKHLDVSDLLLFVPAASGSERDLMRDPVVCLILLKRIFTHIQQNRPSI